MTVDREGMVKKEPQGNEAMWLKLNETVGPFDPEQEKALLSRIVMSPGVLDGLPVIKNTGILVEVVLHLLGRGLPETEIQDSLSLSKEDMRAVFLYAGTGVNYSAKTGVPIGKGF